MMQFFFAVAFSAVPLTLYVPPVRHLTLFVESIQDMVRESGSYSGRIYPRLRIACNRLLNLFLCGSSTVRDD